MSEPAPVSGDSTVADEVGELLSEFTSRLQRREQIGIDEFIALYPQFADDLRRLLPTALALTGLIPSAEAGMLPGQPALSTLGDFQLLREIGRGGMGVVYEAVQISLGRRVALKVLPFAGVLDPRHLQRFQNEARAAATLDHPHIVHVHAVSQDRGVHYYAMQLIEGQTLAEFLNSERESPTSLELRGSQRLDRPPTDGIREAPADFAIRTSPSTTRKAKLSTANSPDQQAYVRQVARWGIEAAEALDHAHQMGIVHRDIKPSNLLINEAGKLWVTDFGLAMTRNDTALTMTGDVLGTLRYMSPEQLSGLRNVVDHRTDVYSLGATLHELLARKPLFADIGRAEIMQRILHEEPTPLRKIQAQIPVDLETIVLKCLQKEPSHRYATSQELAHDLQRFLDVRPILARKPPLREILAKWGRRHLSALTAALLVAIVSVIALSVSVVLIAQARRVAVNEEYGRRMELAQFEFERSVAKCSSDDAAGGLLWLTRSLERARELGAADLEVGIRRQIAGWSQHVPELQMMWSHPAAVTQAWFLPDGKTAITVCRDDGVRLWDVATGELKFRPLKHRIGIRTAIVNPAGTVIAAGGINGTVQCWDALSGAPHGPPFKHDGSVVAAAFRADGQVLATGSDDQAVRLWDVATGQPIGEPLRHEAPISCLAFSPSGKRLLSGDGSGRVELWDAATGDSLGIRITHKYALLLADFSPDSRQVVTAVRDTAFLWNAETGDPIATLSGHVREVRLARFSPDGKIVMTGSPDRTARLWETAGGRPLGLPLDHNAAITSAEFSADGTMLLTASLDGKARLWDVATGQQLGSAINCQEGIGQAAWSPDSRTVLTGDHRGFGRIWDVSNILPRRSTPLPDGPFHALAVNPQQSLLVTGKESESFLWDMKTRQRHGRPLHFNGRTRQAVFSPDGKTLLITSDGFEPVRLWNVETREPIGHSPKLPTPIYDAAFAPDGKTFATAGSELCVRMWDAATLQPVGEPLQHPNAVLAVAFSPDGKTLLTGCVDHHVRRWNMTTRALIEPTLQHAEQVSSVAYSGDGRTIITSSYDHTARLWDATTGQPKGQPLDHGDVAVRFATLTPDEKTLVTVTGANEVRFWNLSTGQPMGPPNPFFVEPDSACLTADGTQVFALGPDSTIQSWPLPQPLSGSIEEIAAWSTTITGMKLDGLGKARPVEAEVWRGGFGRFRPESKESASPASLGSSRDR